MADHLNLAAACISVIGFPHWNNQPLALLTIAAGALPGRWFNPIRIAHKAQNLTSEFFLLSKSDRTSPSPDAETISVDLSSADTTVFSARSVSSSYLVGYSSKIESATTVDSSMTVRNDTVSPDTRAIGDETAVWDDTSLQNNVAPSEMTSANVDNESMGDDEMVHTGVPAAYETHKDSSSSWPGGFLFWFNKVPLDPSYANVQTQTDSVTPKLGFSSMLKVFVEPVPIALKQPDISMVAQIAPITLPHADAETQTSPMSLPYIDTGVQVKPVVPTLTSSSIEQLSVDPVAVNFQQSAVTTVFNAKPVRHPYTNAGVQAEPVHASLRISSIEQISVEPVPVQLLSYNSTGVQVEPVDPILGISSIERNYVEPILVQVSYTEVGAQTEPTRLNYSNIGEASSSPADGFPAIHVSKKKDLELQKDSVEDKQKEPIAQADSGPQMEPMEPADPIAPTVTQQLAYNPFPYGTPQSGQQKRHIDTLNRMAWPYGPTAPAPEGWQTRKDFAYPLPSKPTPPNSNNPNVTRDRFSDQKRKWKNIRHLREKDAQLDYEEHVLGPGSASRSVERTEYLFRPQYKHMTEHEKAEKEKEAKRLSQQQWRRRQWARNQKPAKAQGDGEQGEASGSAGGHDDPSIFRLDHRNPRNFEAAGFVMPIRLPPKAEDNRAIGRLEENVLINSPREEKVGAKGSGRKTPEEEQGPRQIKLPAIAADNRAIGRPEDNVLINPPQQEKAHAKGPSSEKSQEE
ncbi:hypothetical protein PMIN02_002641 [Paraphaeosphaeria minitans]|uniref:Uncharacterized protein n=1 Tax=Paraphaeosphaeria minitans TaxID=565426 RepID=A0A9P6GIB0_9PLEO|nr:hypothetical protein PMIN01_06915 [Paraphaeosphaeria minitans]